MRRPTAFLCQNTDGILLQNTDGMPWSHPIGASSTRSDDFPASHRFLLSKYRWDVLESSDRSILSCGRTTLRRPTAFVFVSNTPIGCLRVIRSEQIKQFNHLHILIFIIVRFQHVTSPFPPSLKIQKALNFNKLLKK
jgi:hypothetical protein